jgi:hypothetical protein
MVQQLLERWGRYLTNALRQRLQRRRPVSMAWLYDNDQDLQQQTVEEARRAYQEGRTVFVSRLRSKQEKANAWAVPEAAELIEDIEREGWELSHMSDALLGDYFSQMTCIFRRR